MAERYLVPPQVDLWQALHRLAPTAVMINRMPLFRSGEPARRVFLVEAGRVSLHVSAQPDARQPFEIAPAGSVLGLSECMTGEDYKLTAQPGPGSKISYIDREVLLVRLRRDQKVCLQVVHFLSESLHNLYYQLRQLNDMKQPPKKRASAIH